MIICGLKLTHDASVALIENGRLVFSVEIEKLKNNPRYTKMTDWSTIIDVLASFDYLPSEVDQWVIDGWKHTGEPLFGDCNLMVAGYSEFDRHGPPQDRNSFYKWSNSPTSIDNVDYIDPLKLGSEWSYSSYPHNYGHIIGGYCMSPLSKNGQAALVLSWDAGHGPRLHNVYVDDGGLFKIKFASQISELCGTIYGIMRYYFGPYKRPFVYDAAVCPHDPLTNKLFGGYDAPGKLMAYMGHALPWLPYVNTLHNLYLDMEDTREKSLDFNVEGNGMFEHAFMRAAHKQWCAMQQLRVAYAPRGPLADACALASMQAFLTQLLIRRLKSSTDVDQDLIFVGGSALNIKWNSALVACGHFKSVWVPPCPNDSGSAIGAACCAMVDLTNQYHLEWDVYSGPSLKNKLSLDDIETIKENWDINIMSPFRVGQLLAQAGGPMLFMLDNAEIGPRALGHRSIIADPRFIESKNKLNTLKGRELWRPVSPMCIEEYAPAWFVPGTPDPYMLFEHGMQTDMAGRVPAIIHIDGSARLQTVGDDDCVFVREMLEGFYTATGVPMVCNTSANLNGSGFFPDTISALSWAFNKGLNTAYIENKLYTRIIKNDVQATTENDATL